MWAPIWSSEDLKLVRYFECCLQTTAISDTCDGEGLQSKPSAIIHARGLFSLAHGTESHFKTLWTLGIIWPIALWQFCVWLCGIFFFHTGTSQYLAGDFQHVLPTCIDLGFFVSASSLVFCAAQAQASTAPAPISIFSLSETEISKN